MKRCLSIAAKLAICLSLLMFAVPAFSQSTNNAEVTTAGGLHVATFDVAPGKIRVNLPSDLSAGDTISGTVILEPAGATEAERRQNAKTLEGYAIDLGDGKRVSADQPRFTWTPQIAQPAQPTRYAIKVIELVPAASAMNAGTTSTGVPVNVIQPRPAGHINPPLFSQAGRPLDIPGPFDGDASNTRVLIGGILVDVLAESPRKAVVAAPAEPEGPIQITVSEGGVETTRPIRNLGIRLSAPKTNLIKGERTQVTVRVSGLQGVTTNVPLRMVTTGVVNMQGGNIQNIQINPKQVGADGSYSRTFDITGTQAGGFNVTGTVRAKPGDR